MLTRLLLSILIDSDRWDSACFEYGINSTEEERRPNWNDLLNTYETYAKNTLNSDEWINKKRSEISDICKEKAAMKTGIYRLSVPTGGGKTFSSLRYALRHADINSKERIFYIIPYNTILDQNAEDIREALNQYEGILEHHSNIVLENDEEQLNYKKLTERWDSDIILTSMVQFLNTLFRKENSNTRRMHRLTNAVFIFDEVQALPINCKGLFERAIIFLTSCCRSTVLLCTATQMELDLPQKPIELMGTEENLISLNRTFKRVEYIPQIEKTFTNEQVAENLCDIIENKKSVLMISNTKASAWDIFEKTCNMLNENGYEFIEIEYGMSDKEIQERAKQSEDFEILCVHLSTFFCPAHRKAYIKWIKNWTKAEGRVLCVSTALIEADINVSFPVVVRSIAGLPSIIQAAGRCNRNMEQSPNVGQVYIWRLKEENLNVLNGIAYCSGQAKL